MNEDSNNEIVKDLPLHPKTDEIVNGSLHDHLLGTEPAPNLSNSFKAKYSLIAVDNADIHTEIISRPEKMQMLIRKLSLVPIMKLRKKYTSTLCTGVMLKC